MTDIEKILEESKYSFDDLVEIAKELNSSDPMREAEAEIKVEDYGEEDKVELADEIMRMFERNVPADREDEVPVSVLNFYGDMVPQGEGEEEEKQVVQLVEGEQEEKIEEGTKEEKADSEDVGEEEDNIEDEEEVVDVEDTLVGEKVESLAPSDDESEVEEEKELEGECKKIKHTRISSFCEAMRNGGTLEAIVESSQKLYEECGGSGGIGGAQWTANFATRLLVELGFAKKGENKIFSLIERG